MRKLFISAMVLAVVVFAANCSKEAEKPKPAEEKAAEKVKAPEVKKVGVADILPENTEVLVKFNALETLHKTGSMTDTTAFGQPIKNLEELKTTLGFNPFNLAEVKARGFDPGKEVGFAVADIVVEKESSEHPNFNGLLFIPVTDGKKALETMIAAIKKESPETKVTEEGNLTVVEDTAQDKFYFAVKDAYLLAAANPKADAKPFMEAVLARQSSLAKATAYTNLIVKVNPKEELFVYVNIGQIMNRNLAAIKEISQADAASQGKPDMSASLDYLSAYEGAGLTFDLESPTLTIRGAANFTAGAKLLNMWQGITLNKNAVFGIPEHPAVFLSALVNVAEVYDMIVAAMPEQEAQNFKAQLEMTKTAMGIDIEKDVLQNIAGNLNVGIYDGGSITMMNYNALATLSVKDEAVMKGVIDKIMAMQPGAATKETVGDVEAYAVMAGFTQIYVGVKNKNLIVAVGKPMFEKAITGDVGAGFVSKLADKTLADTLNSDKNLLYLNSAELLKAAKNFEMMLAGFTGGKGIDQKTQDAASQFEYVLASNALEGNSVVGEFMIKTKFTEPFFIAVNKLAQSFTAQPPAEQPPAEPPQ